MTEEVETAERKSVLRKHQVGRKEQHRERSAGEVYSPDRALLQYCANYAFLGLPHREHAFVLAGTKTNRVKNHRSAEGKDFQSVFFSSRLCVIVHAFFAL